MIKKYVYTPPVNGFPEWNNNPDIFELNRMKAHASFLPFTMVNGSFILLKILMYALLIFIVRNLIAAVGMILMYRHIGSLKAMIIRNIRMSDILGKVKKISSRLSPQ